MKEQSVGVEIPESVVISGQKMIGWYFMGRNNEILKKKSSKITADEVMTAFSRNKSRSGIVASLVLSKYQAKTISDKSQNENRMIVVRYLNLKQLQTFLFKDLANNSLDDEMLLQHFIDPNGDQNSQIEAVWSPNMKIFTRCINNQNLYNNCLDLYERAVTFDGPQVFSTSSCVKGKIIPAQIQDLCQLIISRIALFTKNKMNVSRMNLYFKVDHHNRLHFLYCTSLRVEQSSHNHQIQNKQIQAGDKGLNEFQQEEGKDKANGLNETQKNKQVNEVRRLIQMKGFNNEPMKMSNIFEQLNNLRNTYSISSSRPVRLENNIECPNCEKMCQSQDMAELPLSYLLNQKRLQGKVQKKNKHDERIEVIHTRRQIMEHIKEAKQNPDFNFEKSRNFLEKNCPPHHSLAEKLFPKMTQDKFIQLSEQGYFESHRIHICHECYFKSIRKSSFCGIYHLPKEIQPNSSSLQKQIDFESVTLDENDKKSKDNIIESNEDLIQKNEKKTKITLNPESIQEDQPKMIQNYYLRNHNKNISSDYNKLSSKSIQEKSTTHMFSQKLPRFSLEKNYQLSKEFDIVRYYPPQVFEKQLNMITAAEKFIDLRHSPQNQANEVKKAQVKSSLLLNTKSFSNIINSISKSQTNDIVRGPLVLSSNVSQPNNLKKETENCLNESFEQARDSVLEIYLNEKIMTANDKQRTKKNNSDISTNLSITQSHLSPNSITHQPQLSMTYLTMPNSPNEHSLSYQNNQSLSGKLNTYDRFIQKSKVQINQDKSFQKRKLSDDIKINLELKSSPNQIQHSTCCPQSPDNAHNLQQCSPSTTIKSHVGCFSSAYLKNKRHKMSFLSSSSSSSKTSFNRDRFKNISKEKIDSQEIILNRPNTTQNFSSLEYNLKPIKENTFSTRGIEMYLPKNNCSHFQTIHNIYKNHQIKKDPLNNTKTDKTNLNISNSHQSLVIPKKPHSITNHIENIPRGLSAHLFAGQNLNQKKHFQSISTAKEQ